MAISPQRLTIYLYSAHRADSAHRAVIFARAQLTCSVSDNINKKCLSHYFPKWGFCFWHETPEPIFATSVLTFDTMYVVVRRFMDFYNKVKVRS